MIPNCVGLKKVCGDLLTSLLCIFPEIVISFYLRCFFTGMFLASFSDALADTVAVSIGNNESNFQEM